MRHVEQDCAVEQSLPLHTDTEDTEQPTLAEILRAVHACTASVNTLKEQFGGLRENVSLQRQDLQKIREHTTTVGSRVSVVEDKLPPVVREAYVAHQLARNTNNRADDMENHF